MHNDNRLALVAVLGLAGLASAETILINFGGIADTRDCGGDGLAPNWNTVAGRDVNAPNPDFDTLAAGTVLDSDGNALAGVSISGTTTSGWYGTSTSNSGTYPGDEVSAAPVWLDLDAIEVVEWDQYGGLTLTIEGLTGSAYQVDVIAVRSESGTSTREQSYWVDGVRADGIAGDWNAYSQGWQSGGVMTWSSVAPTDGVLTLRTGDGLGNNSYLAAARITAVPEPATMGLLALGGLAILRRRRC
jgi:hypothetical protein